VTPGSGKLHVVAHPFRIARLVAEVDYGLAPQEWVWVEDAHRLRGLRGVRVHLDPTAWEVRAWPAIADALLSLDRLGEVEWLDCAPPWGWF
jgi:hypothetical protein